MRPNSTPILPKRSGHSALDGKLPTLRHDLPLVPGIAENSIDLNKSLLPQRIDVILGHAARQLEMLRNGFRREWAVILEEVSEDLRGFGSYIGLRFQRIKLRFQFFVLRLENFWSLLKRMIHGTYVKPMPFHMHRYLDEQVARFNERKETDSDRFMNTLSRVSDRRLTYKKLTGKDGESA